MKKIVLLLLVSIAALSVFTVNVFGEVSDFRISVFESKDGAYVEKEKFSDGENLILLEKNADGSYKQKEQLYLMGFWIDDSSGEPETKYMSIIPTTMTIANSNRNIVYGNQAKITFYKTGTETVTYTTKATSAIKGVYTYTIKFKVVDKEEYEAQQAFSVKINSPSSLTAGQDANITATATNNTTSGSAIKTALLIVTLYDESGKMVNYSYAEKNVPSGETIKLGAGFKLPAGSRGYKVQAVVWDGWPDDSDLSKGKPLSDAVTVTVK